MVLKHIDKIKITVFLLLISSLLSAQEQPLKKNTKQFSERDAKQAIKLIEKDSSNFEAWQNLCFYYYQKADTSSFVKSAEYLTLIKEFYAPELIENLTFYYFGKQQYMKVIELLEKHKAKPLSIDSYFLKGRSYLLLKGYEQAEVLFEAVTSMAPTWVDGWIEKGKTRLMLKNYNEAKKSFEKATELNANNAEAYFGIALCMIKGGDHTLAPCSFLKKAKELGYKDSNNYFDNHCAEHFK